jgi:hypothetical protein
MDGDATIATEARMVRASATRAGAATMELGAEG